jgi:ribonuclease-3
MTSQRQKLVCQNALDSAVDGLDVWQYLLYEGSEHNLQGKPKSSLFEAIVAAIYLDGGMDAAKKFILAHGNLTAGKSIENPKGELKEFLEKRGEKEPVYRTEKTGKDNEPIYHTTVSAMGLTGTGEGRSKKLAETSAAKELLVLLNGKNK